MSKGPLWAKVHKDRTIKQWNKSFWTDELNFKMFGSNRAIGLMSRVFANGPRDQRLILGQIILKTQKKGTCLAALLSTQHYKVRIKGKVEQFRELNSALLGVVAIEKGAFGPPSTMVANSRWVYVR